MSLPIASFRKTKIKISLESNSIKRCAKIMRIRNSKKSTIKRKEERKLNSKAIKSCKIIGSKVKSSFQQRKKLKEEDKKG